MYVAAYIASTLLIPSPSLFDVFNFIMAIRPNLSFPQCVDHMSDPKTWVYKIYSLIKAHVKMAQEALLELKDKNKLFNSATQNNRVPCPHIQCSVNAEKTFFDENVGLETHFRVSHKGQYNQSTIEEGRKLRRKLHFEVISLYLDSLYIQTQNAEVCVYDT